MDASTHTFEIKSAEAADDTDLVTKAIDDFKSAVDERLVGLETKTADRLTKLELIARRPGAAVETKSVDEKAAFGRKSFVNYLRLGEQRLGAEEIKALDEIKSLTVGNLPSAGYLVPPTFAAELLKYLVQFSPIRAYASGMQISSNEVIMPRRTSEVSATWTTETGTQTPSNTGFEQVTITPQLLTSVIDISTTLLEDNSYNLEGEIAIQFGESFGKTEGAAFVNGTGVNQPIGLLTSTQISSMASKTTAVVTIDDVIAMYHAIPSAWAQNAVWLMNRLTLGTLRGLKDSVGRPYLIDPMSAGGATTLLGRPIVEAIDMPNTATGATPILFGDLGGYRIVDRVGLSTLRDPVTQAGTNTTRFYARKRVGGDVVDGQRFIKLTVA